MKNYESSGAFEGVGISTGPPYKTNALHLQSTSLFGGVGRNAGPPYKLKRLSSGELYRGESPWRSPEDFMAPLTLSGSVSGKIPADPGRGIPEVEHPFNDPPLITIIRAPAEFLEVKI